MNGYAQQLKNAFLLAGSVRPTIIQQRLGMPVSSVPISVGVDLLGAWCRRLCVSIEGLNRPIALFRSYDEVPPWARVKCDDVQVQIDSSEHRGTAGVLSDLSSLISFDGDDNEWFLVIEANSCPRADFGPFLEEIDSGSSGLIIGVDGQDSPTGVYAISREVLRLVPRIGYFDLKEQLIPRAVAEGIGVTGVLQPLAIRIDSLVNWRRAVALFGNPDADMNGDSRHTDAELIGNCLIDVGAVVEGATIIDSIVMRNAVVEPGAVVARSAVGANAVVPRDMTIVDGVYLRKGKA